MRVLKLTIENFYFVFFFRKFFYGSIFFSWTFFWDNCDLFSLFALCPCETKRGRNFFGAIIFFFPEWQKGKFLRSWHCNIQGCISCILLFMVSHFMHGSLFFIIAIVFGLPLSFHDKMGENVWITVMNYTDRGSIYFDWPTVKNRWLLF